MNLQEQLDKIGQHKFSKYSDGQLQLYWVKMERHRRSQENVFKNRNQDRIGQKLNLEKAIEIRRLHWEEDVNMWDLCKKFDIKLPSLRKCLLNKSFIEENPKYVGIKFRNMGRGKWVYVYDKNTKQITKHMGYKSLERIYGLGFDRWSKRLNKFNLGNRYVLPHLLISDDPKKFQNL